MDRTGDREPVWNLPGSQRSNGMPTGICVQWATENKGPVEALAERVECMACHMGVAAGFLQESPRRPMKESALEFAMPRFLKASL